ncbi:hypothetical protein QFZ75_007950 [Streptomyces sp. V3I8]|nr:hypothetical protein [Streptomyces sp. V3I8]MDQ1041448.1 hypothetical protein [Streptomyces sp. V3I8]
MTTSDTTAKDAERWRKAKLVLEALVEEDPRCIRVLVARAQRILKEDS